MLAERIALTGALGDEIGISLGEELDETLGAAN
jgi:hypothetical protein